AGVERRDESRSARPARGDARDGPGGHLVGHAERPAGGVGARMRIRLLPIGLLLALVLGASAMVALPGASYAHQDRESPLAGASLRHPAGTDALGRDRLVRVSAALLLSLAGALAASALTTGAA